VPNIFTPDGDGRNDKFYPVMTCNALAYQFKIYNRWGLLIFETSDQDDKWDGTYRGNTVPEGVYFFLIKYNFDSSTGKLYDKVGSVTLLK
jgi:gliding motility-associated-like protein